MSTRHISKPYTQVHIRWMIQRDHPEVLDIERKSFDLPWSLENFRDCMRSRNCIGTVAEKGNMVLGYMLHESNPHSLRVLNFAVHPHFRRHGVGRQLVQKLKSKIYAGGSRQRINLLVFEENLEAQLFWKAQGFQWVQTRKLWDIDCYLMRWVRPSAVVASSSNRRSAE